jgi:uncharacterized protein YaeQ
MTLKATIFKATLQVADTDRHHYGDYALTLARHPSETDERLMVRLVAFALLADKALEFGKGLSSDVEPDLWRKDLTGQIELWVEVGLPNERLIRKVGRRARQVVVLSFGRGVDVWWSENRDRMRGQDNLTVLRLPVEATQALALVVSRTMTLQCTIQEGLVMFTSDSGVISFEPQLLQGGLLAKTDHRRPSPW